MNPPSSKITALVFGIIGMALLLCVVWNIVAPSHLCWLGFWKGLGTLVLAFACIAVAGSNLEE